MATTELRLSSKIQGDGKQQIIVKLNVSRSNRPCFKSGVFVMPEWFKPIQTTSKGNVYGVVVPRKGRLNLLECKEAEEAKNNLESFTNKLLSVCNALAMSGATIDHKSIEEAMELTKRMAASDITARAIADARKEQEDRAAIEAVGSKTIWQLWEEFLTSKELSEGRKRGIHVVIRCMARYEGFVRMTDKERKDFKLDIQTIDKDTLDDLFDYIANEKELSEDYPEVFKILLTQAPAEFTAKHKSNKIEPRGNNIMVSRRKMIKAFLRWCCEQKYTANRAFESIEVGSERYGTPYFLTKQERDIIADWDFSGNKALEEQRDILVAQTCFGCRISDLLKLTADNVVNVEGVECLQYIPQKTAHTKPQVITVPLNGRAKALIQKYRGVDMRGRLFPFISRDNYNDRIKEVLTACGITRMVQVINPTTGREEQRTINEVASSHMMRRTFVGNLYAKVKDPNIVGKLSGHAEGSKAFARYRNIDLDIMSETVSFID